MRKLSVVLLSILIISGASAYTFTAFESSSEKQISGLNTELGIKAVNTSDTELRISFSSPESENYNITLPEDQILPASPETSDPSGGGWLHLGDGSYARVKEFRAEVNISEYRQDNTVSIPVNVSVSPTSTPEGFSSTILSQQRTLDYTISIDESLRPLEREQKIPDQWEEAEINRSNQEREEEPDVNLSQELKVERQENTNGEGGTDRVTWLLVAGIVACLVYIMKVI